MQAAKLGFRPPTLLSTQLPNVRSPSFRKCVRWLFPKPEKNCRNCQQMVYEGFDCEPHDWETSLRASSITAVGLGVDDNGDPPMGEGRST